MELLYKFSELLKFADNKLRVAEFSLHPGFKVHLEDRCAISIVTTVELVVLLVIFVWSVV